MYHFLFKLYVQKKTSKLITPSSVSAGKNSKRNKFTLSFFFFHLHLCELSQVKIVDWFLLCLFDTLILKKKNASRLTVIPFLYFCNALWRWRLHFNCLSSACFSFILVSVFFSLSICTMCDSRYIHLYFQSAMFSFAFACNPDDLIAFTCTWTCKFSMCFQFKWMLTFLHELHPISVHILYGIFF